MKIAREPFESYIEQDLREWFLQLQTFHSLLRLR